MNNIFISYDLNSPGQNYSAVIEAIKSIGHWANVQKSLWYVNTNLSARQVLDRVLAEMDKNDSLIVINVSNNEAVWNGISDTVANYIVAQWNK